MHSTLSLVLSALVCAMVAVTAGQPMDHECPKDRDAPSNHELLILQQSDETKAQIVKERVIKLEEENQKLKADMKKLQKSINKLIAGNKTVSGIEKINDENKKMKAEIEKVQESNQKLQESSQKLQESNQKLQESINKLIAANETLSDEVTSLKNKVGAGTALFSVYMTGSASLFASGEVIPFRGVALNQGGHYSVSTYKFRCPRRGFYYFTFSIYSYAIKYGTSAERSTAALVLDGQNLAQVRSVDYDPDHKSYAQGSSSILVQCPQGGQVWVKSSDNKNQIDGTSGTRETTFSGFLLSYL